MLAREASLGKLEEHQLHRRQVGDVLRVGEWVRIVLRLWSEAITCSDQ